MDEGQSINRRNHRVIATVRVMLCSTLSELARIGDCDAAQVESGHEILDHPGVAEASRVKTRASTISLIIPPVMPRLTAGCIDIGLPAVRRTFCGSDRSFVESLVATAHVNHATRVMSTETRCHKELAQQRKDANGLANTFDDDSA